jgi:D-glutamate cyclase
MMVMEAEVETAIHKMQEIVGTDIGNRGMMALICPGDLLEASKVLANLKVTTDASKRRKKNIIILSGFPCCIHDVPPTESDGPAGALAIARACIALHGGGGCDDDHSSSSSFNVIIITDECNAAVFAACLKDYLALPTTNSISSTTTGMMIQLQTFPTIMSEQDLQRMEMLAQDCALYIACERAGPGKDGVCYTMRGMDMNATRLMAPLERFVLEYRDVQHHKQHDPDNEQQRRPTLFIAIGDGGNELGMGKVMDKIIDSCTIPNGDKIACVVSADYLIAASISNWGGYALAAGAAHCRAAQQSSSSSSTSPLSSLSSSSLSIKEWVNKCLPTEEDEIALMHRGVAAGMRDGVTGNMEATVDGFPLETSLQCLRDIRAAALAAADE